jgi:hypothetical protein
MFGRRRGETHYGSDQNDLLRVTFPLREPHCRRAAARKSEFWLGFAVDLDYLNANTEGN